MDWAIATGYKIDPDICSFTDEASNRVMLKHLQELGFDWGSTLESSAWKGDFEFVKYAIENGCPVGMSMSRAADGGHLEICQWLHSRGEEIDDYTCLCTVSSFRKNIIRWIIEVQPVCRGYLLKAAYRTGNVKIAKLLRKLGYFHHEMLMFDVFEHGHLEMLKWYLGIGGNIGDWVIFAAGMGHLHFLKWFEETAVIINYDGCIAAAEAGGHTDCVEWLRANK